MKIQNKKAMSQKILVYVLMTFTVMIVMIAILNGIFTIKDKKDQVDLDVFYKQLKSEATVLQNKFGSVEFKELFVGDKYSQVCFSQYKASTSENITNNQLKDIIDNEVEENIFFFQGNKFTSYYLPRIIVEENGNRIVCYNVSKGYIEIRMEGRGNGVLIGKSVLNLTYGDCVIKVPDMMSTKNLQPERWNLDEKYFIKDGDGKVIQVCGPDGWENIEYIG